MLVTLPVHRLSSAVVNDQANDQVKYLVFNDLNEIIAFGNQASDQASDQVNDQASDQANAVLNDAVHARVAELLSIVTHWIKRAELFAKMDLSNHSTNRARYLDPLIELGWVEMEHPESPTHPNQRYKIAPSGSRILKLISPK